MYFILKTNNQFKDINNGRKNKSKLQTEKIDETTKYFLEEIKIDQISKKQKKKKVCMAFNYLFQILLLRDAFQFLFLIHQLAFIQALQVVHWD